MLSFPSTPERASTCNPNLKAAFVMAAPRRGCGRRYAHSPGRCRRMLPTGSVFCAVSHTPRQDSSRQPAGAPVLVSPPTSKSAKELEQALIMFYRTFAPDKTKSDERINPRRIASVYNLARSKLNQRLCAHPRSSVNARGRGLGDHCHRKEGARAPRFLS